MRAGKRPVARLGKERARSDPASVGAGGRGSGDSESGAPAGRESGVRGGRIMGHREGSRMVEALRIRGLLLMLVLFGLAVAACAPPGSDTGGGSGGGGGGEEAQQQVEQSGGGGPVCDVEPPDIAGLEEAVVGFSPSEEETNP